MADVNDSSDVMRMRVQHHIGRARLLLDLVREKENLIGTKLATSLRVVSNELGEAQQVLNRNASPGRVIFHAPLPAETDFEY